MIVSACYAMIMVGVEATSGRFWAALFWPYHLGKILGEKMKKPVEAETDHV